jgi:hypothetical protein
MPGDRLQELVLRCTAQSEFAVDRFARAHHRTGIVDSEQVHEPVQLVDGGCFVEIARQGSIDAVLLEQRVGRPAL